MKEKKIFIGDLHFEHEMWKRELNFCDDEIKILNAILDEVTAKNKDHYMLSEVEHFQNQFIVQKQNIDTFLHHINKDEQNLAQFAKDHPVAIDHVHFTDHGKMRDNMEGFAKIYNELKQEFRLFLTKWM